MSVCVCEFVCVSVCVCFYVTVDVPVCVCVTLRRLSCQNSFLYKAGG